MEISQKIIDYIKRKENLFELFIPPILLFILFEIYKFLIYLLSNGFNSGYLSHYDINFDITLYSKIEVHTFISFVSLITVIFFILLIYRHAFKKYQNNTQRLFIKFFKYNILYLMLTSLSILSILSVISFSLSFNLKWLFYFILQCIIEPKIYIILIILALTIFYYQCILIPYIEEDNNTFLDKTLSKTISLVNNLTVKFKISLSIFIIMLYIFLIYNIAFFFGEFSAGIKHQYISVEIENTTYVSIGKVSSTDYLMIEYSKKNNEFSQNFKIIDLKDFDFTEIDTNSEHDF